MDQDNRDAVNQSPRSTESGSEGISGIETAPLA
jgi:hypothetical protein